PSYSSRRSPRARLPAGMCRRPYTTIARPWQVCGRVFGLRSRIEPGLGPGRLRVDAAEHDPVVQAERPVLPKLDLKGDEPVAAPIGGTRHLAAGETLGETRHLDFKRRTARKRARPGRATRAPH